MSAAASPRVAGRFVKNDRPARTHEGHGAAQPGETGADHVDPAASESAHRHGQASPYLRAIQVFSTAVNWTGSSEPRQPRRNSRRRMRR